MDTKAVFAGNVQIGGGAPVTVQSMTNTDTRDASATIAQIRALADEMLRLVYPVAPALFAAAGPSCVKGACPEGAMSCGDSAGMRAKYASLKKGALN